MLVGVWGYDPTDSLGPRCCRVSHPPNMTNMSICIVGLSNRTQNLIPDSHFPIFSLWKMGSFLGSWLFTDLELRCSRHYFDHRGIEVAGTEWQFLWLQPYLLRNNWGMTGGWIVSNFSGSTAASIGSKLVVNYTTPFVCWVCWMKRLWISELIANSCNFKQFQGEKIWLALGLKWYHIFRQKQFTTVFGTATPVISRIII
jgi:hypothetical protein